MAWQRWDLPDNGCGGPGEPCGALNSWPDNTNLDKARRLLWPIKRKYGNAISWADLIILTGNVALESMGFRTFGFTRARRHLATEEDVFWGRETGWFDHDRTDGGHHQPLAAVELIYVNPEGPGGEPDPVASGRDVRETFARMGMSVEETVALVGGGHTFGNATVQHHHTSRPRCTTACTGPGWHNTFHSGKAEHTITTGIEGRPNSPAGTRAISK